MSGVIDTIVLSGGALNGIVMLGSLQCYYDKKLLDNVKTYVGTSVGSIISYLLIIGYTPIEIFVYLSTHPEFFEKLRSMDIISASRGEGAISFSNITDELEKMTIEKTGKVFTMKELFNRFNKKLVCVTYNISQTKIEYISHDSHDSEYADMPCMIALKMSSNLPLIFEQFKYGKSYYVDGGFGDNFPVKYAETLGDKILGVCVTYDLAYNIEDNPLTYIYKLMYVPIQQTMNTQIENRQDTSVIIDNKIADLSFFNFNNSSKERLGMFTVGYSNANLVFN